MHVVIWVKIIHVECHKCWHCSPEISVNPCRFTGSVNWINVFRYYLSTKPETISVVSRVMALRCVVSAKGKINQNTVSAGNSAPLFIRSVPSSFSTHHTDGKTVEYHMTGAENDICHYCVSAQLPIPFFICFCPYSISLSADIPYRP